MKASQKILIVDDEPGIVMSLEFLMKKEGYQVYIARDGAEALDIIRQEHPDLVVLDVMMPSVDGYEVCRQVKEDETLRRTKVIFLSAKSKDTDIEKGLSLGADLYLTKPFSTRNLMAKVQELTA
ncbi:response regulator transcription factor [Siphonobacter aquaeclarae]|jgi:DNA-binding response OmpR family regulator|uniref:Response regulator receiver domain-containing protein n=1 Tax=Siphonobacter aquaeclarae TaxID=563176 RepID=A0A1G9KPE5_9BACT|nr:response regulator [Siphonobacter aquaeclarae]SDL51559.1 Response regulator receiver domain-containing protein [Siphonobacter aquaeclarae]